MAQLKKDLFTDDAYLNDIIVIAMDDDYDAEKKEHITKTLKKIQESSSEFVIEHKKQELEPFLQDALQQWSDNINYHAIAMMFRVYQDIHKRRNNKLYVIPIQSAEFQSIKKMLKKFIDICKILNFKQSQEPKKNYH